MTVKVTVLVSGLKVVETIEVDVGVVTMHEHT